MSYDTTITLLLIPKNRDGQYLLQIKAAGKRINTN